MTRLWRLLLRLPQSRCRHEGGWLTFGALDVPKIQWCRVCGAYRFESICGSNSTYGAWFLPGLVK